MNIIVGESLHGAPITVVSWPFEMRGFWVRVITNPRKSPEEHLDDWSDCSPGLSLETVPWVFRASAHPSHHRAPCWHIHWYFHGILSDALRTFFGWSATSWHGIINFRRGRRFGGSREKTVERDTEIMSIMADLTRFFLSYRLFLIRVEKLSWIFGLKISPITTTTWCSSLNGVGFSTFHFFFGFFPISWKVSEFFNSMAILPKKNETWKNQPHSANYTRWW